MWGERPQPESAQYVAKPVKCAELKRGVKMTFDGRGTEKITKGQSLQMSTVWWDFFCCCFVCYRHSLSNNSHSLTVMGWLRDLVRKKREGTRIMSRH